MPYGCTDRDVVWAAIFRGPIKPCIRLGPNPHEKRQFWGLSGPLKALGVSPTLYAAKQREQKIKHGHVGESTGLSLL